MPHPGKEFDPVRTETPGVYRRKDRFCAVISVGNRRQRWITRDTYEEACEARLHAQAAFRRSRKDEFAALRGDPSLAKAYSSIRVAAQHIDRFQFSGHRKTRARLNEALSAIYRAEDELSLAMKELQVEEIRYEV